MKISNIISESAKPEIYEKGSEDVTFCKAYTIK